MRIGSATKTFTVTAILMLADQGKLGLDDPVDRYVKEVPGGNQVTLRQLAAMRSGLYDYSEDTKAQMTENLGRQWTPRELRVILGNVPPAHGTSCAQCCRSMSPTIVCPPARGSSDDRDQPSAGAATVADM